MNVTGLTSSVAGNPIGAAGSPVPQISFSDALTSAVNQVESSQTAAQSSAMALLANGTGDVHTVALAAQRAELSMELFQQVRNKFVQAYQEIMKMPM